MLMLVFPPFYVITTEAVCYSKPVAFPVPVLQEWGRGLPYPLLPHAHIWGYPPLLHGVGTRPVPERGTHFRLIAFLAQHSKNFSKISELLAQNNRSGGKIGHF